MPTGARQISLESVRAGALYFSFFTIQKIQASLPSCIPTPAPSLRAKYSDRTKNGRAALTGSEVAARTVILSGCICHERATRIELAFSAWEADVLPLNYARKHASCFYTHYRMYP